MLDDVVRHPVTLPFFDTNFLDCFCSSSLKTMQQHNEAQTKNALKIAFTCFFLMWPAFWWIEYLTIKGSRTVIKPDRSLNKHKHEESFLLW